ncbi:S-adenosylmethionine:tRNA ribosyltransferase-isomerase, partial [Methylobacterium sp. WL116]|uniref:S-adenosylmethionine:tRNA ribosyltransferase-isomerase n=1 Tax=Methylobacterium sp. WL116 TaxID=2603889 RepID=UPI0011D2EDE0
MRVDLFDFDLPEASIALRPAEPRGAGRLLVVRPGDGLTDARVADLPGLLRRGDALVFNDTRVIPARLRGIRTRPGAPGQRTEVMLHLREAPDRLPFTAGAILPSRLGASMP